MARELASTLLASATVEFRNSAEACDKVEVLAAALLDAERRESNTGDESL